MIKLLYLSIKDIKWPIYINTAEALSKMRPKEAIKPFLLLLKSENDSIRWKAIKILGDIGLDSK
jgi:HEAT repeat protein